MAQKKKLHLALAVFAKREVGTYIQPMVAITARINTDMAMAAMSPPLSLKIFEHRTFSVAVHGVAEYLNCEASLTNCDVSVQGMEDNAHSNAVHGTRQLASCACGV